SIRAARSSLERDGAVSVATGVSLAAELPLLTTTDSPAFASSTSSSKRCSRSTILTSMSASNTSAEDRPIARRVQSRLPAGDVHHEAVDLVLHLDLAAE